MTSWLPDVSRMSLDELAVRYRDDPDFRAVVDQAGARIVDQEPADGCGC